MYHMHVVCVSLHEFIYNTCMYVCVCMCLHECMCVSLHEFMCTTCMLCVYCSCELLMWGVGTGLSSCSRAASSLNCGGVDSPF